MLEIFKISKSSSDEKNQKSSQTQFGKSEELTDVGDFVDQKLGGFLNFTKESLERCEILSKRAYVDSNLYTLLVFWMTKFMEFFATVVFEALNSKIEKAVQKGKEVPKEGSSKSIKFEWNLFKKKPKREASVKVSPFLSPEMVDLLRSVYLLVFRFNAKNQKFMEKIRASNYFSECDQIRGKIFDMLKAKTSHLMRSVFSEMAGRVADRLTSPDFVKSERHPRVVEQFLLFFGKYFREVALLANKELTQTFKLNLFLSLNFALQRALLTISKSLFKKVFLSEGQIPS